MLISICHDSMAHPGFGHLWQQAEMSDMDIVIVSAQDAAPAGDDDPKEQNSTLLQQFPGHSMILSSSPYFKAQALRWSKPSQPRDSSQSEGTSTPSSKRQAKQLVTITLPDASYEPAAMAVLAGLYLVQPWPKLLAGLTPQQQVQAAVLADMWQLPAASTAAAGVLDSAKYYGVDKVLAVFEQLHSMPAMPDCLLSVYDKSWQALLSKYSTLAAVPDRVLPVFEQVLLGKYGDLEAVWDPAGAALQESLLALPLYAMELLLASDRLKVACEDTVLFTAQAYVVNLSTLSDRKQAMDKLAPLVRCPHLSQFWLSASVLSDDARKLLLHKLRLQLKRLMLLKPTCGTAAADGELAKIPDVPASWLLPTRDITPVSSANMQWELDVAAIRQAAQESARQQTAIPLWAPNSCLVGGIEWSMTVECTWEDNEGGSTIVLLAVAESLPAGSFCRCKYTLALVKPAAVDCCDHGMTTDCFGSDSSSWGWVDFFDVGAMSGGFDEAAWAANGLPTTGSITLQLTVHAVGM